MPLFKIPLLSSIFVVVGLILSGCNEPSSSEGSSPSEKPVTNSTLEGPTTSSVKNKPPRIFLRCRSCHSYEIGKKNAVGPNLVDVFGNPAGADPDYKFSKEILESEIVWNYETLDAFLISPSKTIPGTKMAFIGLKKKDDRAELIKWIESLNAEQ